MRPVIAAVVLGGCFSPQPAAGIPCADVSAAVRCPSGLVCVSSGGIETCERAGGTEDAAVVDDAPIDQAPPIDACQGCLDTDGDGIANMDDNCVAIANSDQSDEDGDDIGDPCDPCPVNTNNTDDDGDGVGNNCDPSSATVDHIAQFVSFASATLPAGWAIEGNVTIANGEATAVAPQNGGAYVRIAAPTGFVAVWAVGTLTAFDGNALVGMGVMDRYDANSDTALACQLVGTTSGSTQELRLYDSATPTVVASAAHPMVVGTASLLRITRETPTTYRCSATAPFVDLPGSSTVNPPTPQVGVRMRNGTAKFRWVMVLTR